MCNCSASLPSASQGEQYLDKPPHPEIMETRGESFWEKEVGERTSGKVQSGRTGSEDRPAGMPQILPTAGHQVTRHAGPTLPPYPCASGQVVSLLWLSGSSLVNARVGLGLHLPKQAHESPGDVITDVGFLGPSLHNAAFYSEVPPRTLAYWGIWEMLQKRIFFCVWCSISPTYINMESFFH